MLSDEDAGRQRCGVAGCTEEPIECRHAGRVQSDPPGEWLCPTHACAAGYCAGCGDFCAGLDPFDRTGLCEHCWAECRADDDCGGHDDGYYDYGIDWDEASLSYPYGGD